MKFKSHHTLKLVSLLMLAAFALTKDAVDVSKTSTDATAATDPSAKTAAPVTNPNYTVVTCNPDVVGALSIAGLTPVTQSIEKGFPACPRVKNACCAASDASSIVAHWTATAQPRVKKGLSAQRDIYAKMLERMVKASDKARKVYSKLMDAPEKECKVLARFIVSLRIEKIVTALKASMSQCHDFMERAYKSVYCSVCDGDYQQYIDVGKKSFGLSSQDCRNLGLGCHKFLLYMQAHIPEKLNLLLDFATQCTDEGVFTAKPTVNEIKRNDDVAQKLIDMRDNRDSADWETHFAPLCNSFSFGQVTDYFMPNIVQYNGFVTNFDAALAAGAAPAAPAVPAAAGAGATGAPGTAAPAAPAEGAPAAPATPAPPATGAPSKTRLLGEAAVPAKTEVKPDAKPATPAPTAAAPGDIDPLKPFKVFNTDASKAIPIDDMVTATMDPGIDIFFISARSLMSADAVAAAQAKAAAAAPAATAATGDAAKKSRRLRKSNSRKVVRRARRQTHRRHARSVAHKLKKVRL